MKISYDKKADALNIVLRKGKVARTEEVAPEIFLDLDEGGNPLYLEIIGASEKIGKKNFADVAVGNKLVKLFALT